jgi:23S rRNA (guanosine2251-2'-O)-methyltransferase
MTKPAELNKPFWIYGINPINAVLKNRTADVRRIVKVIPRSNRREDGDLKIDPKGIKVENIELERFIELTDFRRDVVHQNIAAYINPPSFFDLREITGGEDQGRNKLFLMLDGLTDPRNLGAIIRTADACGVDAIILPKDRSAHIDATVYKTSSGAIENVKICMEVNLSRSIEFLQEKLFMVYGLYENAQSNIYEEKFTTSVCCVIGGEDTGIRRLVGEHCDKMLKIPMAAQAHSLNASVAAAVFMYEVHRQFNFPLAFSHKN